MKSVLLSIKPKYCELIAGGIKTIEVRKTKPKLDTPFKCYIYETKTKDFYSVLHKKIIGKVIGEFICNKVDNYDDNTIHCFSHEDYIGWNDFDLDRCCIHPQDFEEYANGKWLYGWHISNLKIYDTPKELSGFIPNCTELQNGECMDFKNTSCVCQEKDYNPDGMVNVCKCINRMYRPPQSWCYVEEVTE